MKKDNLPLISVIIPVYNVENYLRTTLQTILNQTYRNIEIILIDDNSSDSTCNICKEYMQKDSRVKTVFHTENQGIGRSRSEGIEIAKGVYSCFVDGDDIIHPQTIEIFKTILINGDFDIVIGNSIFIGEEEKIEMNPIKLESVTIEKIDCNTAFERMFLNYPYDSPYLVVWNKLFKTALLKGIKVNYRGGEDAYINYFVYNKAEKIAVIKSKPTYFYIQRKTSVFHSVYNQAQLDQLLAFFEIENVIYQKESPFYSKVAMKTYKRILSAKYNSRRTTYYKHVKNTIKEYGKSFKKRFYSSKGNTLNSKILMFVFEHIPFTYRFFRYIDKKKSRKIVKD